MAKCELCDREFKTTQGLRGHMTFLHQVAANGDTKPVARLATEQQLSVTEQRLGEMEVALEQVASDTKSATELAQQAMSKADQLPSHSHIEFNNLQQISNNFSTMNTLLKKITDQIEKFDLCPRCGQLLHLQRNNDSSWFLQCLHCGSRSVTYKPLPCTLTEFRLKG